MSLLMRFALLALLSAVAACSSTPQVTELPNSAEPNKEMTRLDGEIKTAIENQVNVLSPVNFKNATEELDKAKEARNHDKDQKEILHRISVAQAYLDKANAVVAVEGQLIPGVIKERAAALAAQSPKYFSSEFTSADNDLESMAKNIEANDTSDAEKLRGKLEARYSDLELRAIRKAKLGDARTNMEQAIKEGAEKLVPQTLAWAKKKIDEDDAIVTADRHNTVNVDKASSDATMASARLLTMVRQAKNATQLTPEQLARQSEKNQLALNGEETKLSAKNAEIEETKSQAESAVQQSESKLAAQREAGAAILADNQKLEEKNKLEQQYEFARQEFTSDEAEVYKQGDKLLLRLKGLSFPKDQAVITVNNYPLLAKVQKVIKEVAPEEIVIEGHTDSRGLKAQNEKLSTARAESVEEYLKANNSVESAKISAAGYGDTKPIASNKTKSGRAQNRRVDVILNSTSVK